MSVITVTSGTSIVKNVIMKFMAETLITKEIMVLLSTSTTFWLQNKTTSAKYVNLMLEKDNLPAW